MNSKQFILATVTGAVVLFLWNAVSWMVLPFHSQTLNSIPESAIEAQALKDQMPEPGVYHYPGMPVDNSTEARDEVSRQMSEGPVISLMIFLPEGADPFPVANFVFGLLINLAAAGLAVFLLKLTAIRKYWNKVVFVGLLGTFAVLSASLPEFLWFGYPADYVITGVFDVIFGWTLAGAAIAKIVLSSES